MSDWISQYSAALDERDRREKANEATINAYTKLADRTAALEAAARAATHPPPPSSPVPESKARPGTPQKAQRQPPSKDTEPVPTDALSALRFDLASTQQSRAALTLQVATLATSRTTLLAQTTKNTAQIATLTSQIASLTRKIADRDSELREKARLVQNVQDEMVALSLQLNMAEQRAEKLARENEELVKRWMERVGREAEEMNRDSRWE
ncbi:hypothetical protein B0A49_02589 [Cryomyces minteri]|uniref:Autophagy-related protein 16 domain-containing protein n=1 Tax=Cryomyces minteri TaxID=331657 RepID=A0A4V5NHY9_9PEZI|nr:hypothetical protein B0A49_02589 [Cryomyces minteri]